MAEFLIKVADERGRMLEQVENGYSEAEVRDRILTGGISDEARDLLAADMKQRGSSHSV